MTPGVISSSWDPLAGLVLTPTGVHFCFRGGIWGSERWEVEDLSLGAFRAPAPWGTGASCRPWGPGSCVMGAGAVGFSVRLPGRAEGLPTPHPWAFLGLGQRCGERAPHCTGVPGVHARLTYTSPPCQHTSPPPAQRDPPPGLCCPRSSLGGRGWGVASVTAAWGLCQEDLWDPVRLSWS